MCPNPTIILTAISPKYVEYPVKKINLKEHIQTEATIKQVSLHIFLFLWVGLYTSVFLSSQACIVLDQLKLTKLNELLNLEHIVILG